MVRAFRTHPCDAPSARGRPGFFQTVSANGPDEMSERMLVGLDDPLVAAQLAQERERSDLRSSNARYRIKKRAATAGAGDGPRRPLQSLVASPVHVPSQLSPVARSQASALPPQQTSAALPPRPSRKQRRADWMNRTDLR